MADLEQKFVSSNEDQKTKESLKEEISSMKKAQASIEKNVRILQGIDDETDQIDD
eukprot:CAMPEP_0170479014 /NCGR_PEP_ID=MMETSP0208-20121228/396_1 /TAXON_ID=197538 /ORGANISM="Strombidium inclinatum, Strain S3" /LENGTH=54 /DNA_ID=CAMNT_0010751353 /DNA_START=1242 /DNA_END=1406 /DNA_ORIENTATION=-